MLLYSDADLLVAAQQGLNFDSPALVFAAAESLILRATRRAVYATDSNHVARDEKVRTALHDAVMAQVSTWWRLGVTEPHRGSSSLSTPAAAGTIKMGSVSVSTGATSQETAAYERALESLTEPVPEAMLVLESAGLLDGPLTVYGGFDGWRL